jgi:hypothetical protein
MKTNKQKQSKPAKPAKQSKPAVSPQADEPKFTKCKALDVGHRSCHCGREGCGENVTH